MSVPMVHENTSSSRRNHRTPTPRGSSLPTSPIQQYLQQQPVDENGFSVLPHADHQAAWQRTQLELSAVDHQLYQYQGSLDQSQHESTSVTWNHRERRRKQRRQAKNLTAVGSQFVSDANVSTWSQNQGMVKDLSSLEHEQPQQDYEPSGEVLRQQKQEKMDEDLQGVGSRFQ